MTKARLTEEDDLEYITDDDCPCAAGLEGFQHGRALVPEGSRGLRRRVRGRIMGTRRRGRRRRGIISTNGIDGYLAGVVNMPVVVNMEAWIGHCELSRFKSAAHLMLSSPFGLRPLFRRAFHQEIVPATSRFLSANLLERPRVRRPPSASALPARAFILLRDARAADDTEADPSLETLNLMGKLYGTANGHQ